MALIAMILIAFNAVILNARGQAVQVGVVAPITPYASYVAPVTLIQGATLEWDNSRAGTKQRITRQLEDMRTHFNINTVSIYGLENFDPPGSDANKDWLFSELSRLGMQIVVRVEAYAPDSFAFTDADADTVAARYSALVHYVSAVRRRGRVAYFALNMPVDDTRVQSRLGGLNSALWKRRQHGYSIAIVARMRKQLQADGFPTAQLYLSVFYGWDNTYELPSYADAAADGYFLNNYSYPDGQPRGQAASESALINQPRLQIAMKKFTATYGTRAPFVIEFGFHTLEFDHGVPPTQTAGLVQDLPAKKKALRATTHYYRSHFAGLRGFLYFGYNLFKSEGDPPTVLDWALAYPTGEQHP